MTQEDDDENFIELRVSKSSKHDLYADVEIDHCALVFFWPSKYPFSDNVEQYEKLPFEKKIMYVEADDIPSEVPEASIATKRHFNPFPSPDCTQRNTHVTLVSWIPSLGPKKVECRFELASPSRCHYGLNRVHSSGTWIDEGSMPSLCASNCTTAEHPNVADGTSRIMLT